LEHLMGVDQLGEDRNVRLKYMQFPEVVDFLDKF
jgi:hypothetical protein